MKNLPVVRHFLRILLEPGWAPLGVVGLHLMLAEFGLTESFDHWLHFLGGASMGYLLFRLIEMLSLLGASQGWVRYMVAFTAACTVAVFWEFGEFASDAWLHTAVQRGLNETMLDLLFGVVGATVALVLMAAARKVRRLHAYVANAEDAETGRRDARVP